MKPLLFLLLFYPIIMSAQTQQPSDSPDTCANKHTIREKLNNLLTKRESHQKYDTAYICRPEQKWTIRLRANTSGWKIRSDHYEGLSSVFRSNLNETLSLGIGYRGIMVSMAVNPGKLAGRNSDTEYSIASYGNKFGGEVFYQQSKKFEATSSFAGYSVDASSAIEKISMFNASGYYVFNSRHFSFPTAFCQSYIQKRSAGSWLLGLSVFHANGHINPVMAVGLNDTKLSMFMAGVGGGYGYNLVTRHNWLFHLSAIPNIAIAQHNVMTIDGKKTNMNYKFPELMNTGRLAIIHSFSRYFIGVSAVAHLNFIGNHKHDVFMENLKWKARTFVGVRL